MRGRKVEVDNKEQQFTLILHYTVPPKPGINKSNVAAKPQTA